MLGKSYNCVVEVNYEIPQYRKRIFTLVYFVYIYLFLLNVKYMLVFHLKNS